MSATVLTTSSLKLSTSMSSHHLHSLPSTLCFPKNGSTLLFAKNSFRCNSISPTDPDGENGSKSVLNAFFLGKALAEIVNERVESTLEEFLSTIGRIQAEQQKHVEEFQEEVVERARMAQEKATQEAMALQGLIPKASPVDIPISPSPKNSTKLTDNNGPSTNGPSTSGGIDPLLTMMTDD